MESLFSSLTRAVEGTPAIALGAALIWGILSILLSPCHLASIPLIVGFIDDQGKTSTRRALLISLLFSLGILVTIAAIGAITAAAGRMMGDLGAYANYVVALVFFYVGFSRKSGSVRIFLTIFIQPRIESCCLDKVQFAS